MDQHGTQVLPDLYVVAWLGMTPRQLDCHVYVLRGPDGLLLVDCGTPWGRRRLLRNMRFWGLAPEQVRTILLTHGHVDHVSGGWRFKARGAEVLGHREIQTLVECQWEVCGAVDAHGRSYRLDGFLSDGDVIERCGFRVQVFHTPGHTRGCVSYLIEINGERCLFTGDLIMSNAWPGWHGDPGYSLPEVVASIKRLQGVEFRHLCHGHDVLRDDCGRLFRTALANWESGAWTAPGSPLMTPIPGRAPV